MLYLTAFSAYFFETARWDRPMRVLMRLPFTFSDATEVENTRPNDGYCPTQNMPTSAVTFWQRGLSVCLSIPYKFILAYRK